MDCGGRRIKYKKKYSRDMPVLTIITVVFNGVKTIERTIKSVLQQKYDNIEYILVDGGSSDGTLDVLKKYEDKIDYWISEPDNGIYDAMNKGIRLSSGDYICMLNADDWYEDSACEIVGSKIAVTRSEKDVYYGIARVVDRYGCTVDIHGSTIHMLKRSSIAHQTCFISKKIYRNFQYDTVYKSAADYDLICRLSRNKAAFEFIEEILVNYSLNGMSDSILGQMETYKIRKKYGYISYANYIIHEISLMLSNIRGGK